jgi:hypothetical protein
LKVGLSMHGREIIFMDFTLHTVISQARWCHNAF